MKPDDLFVRINLSAGKRLVQRHQMVYALLNDEMDLNNSG